MSNVRYSDDALARLRVVVDLIGRQLGETSPTPALAAAWTELVDTLALGPAPETRECPSCHSIGMRAASRCGNCWVALAPLSPLSNGAPHSVAL